MSPPSETTGLVFYLHACPPSVPLGFPLPFVLPISPSTLVLTLCLKCLNQKHNHNGWECRAVMGEAVGPCKLNFWACGMSMSTWVGQQCSAGGRAVLEWHGLQCACGSAGPRVLPPFNPPSNKSSFYPFPCQLLPATPLCPLPLPLTLTAFISMNSRLAVLRRDHLAKYGARGKVSSAYKSGDEGCK